LNAALRTVERPPKAMLEAGYRSIEHYDSLGPAATILSLILARNADDKQQKHELLEKAERNARNMVSDSGIRDRSAEDVKSFVLSIVARERVWNGDYTKALEIANLCSNPSDMLLVETAILLSYEAKLRDMKVQTLSEQWHCDLGKWWKRRLAGENPVTMPNPVDEALAFGW